MINQENIQTKYKFEPFPSTSEDNLVEFIRNHFLVNFMNEDEIKIQKYNEIFNGYKFGELKTLGIIKVIKTELFEQILRDNDTTF